MKRLFNSILSRGLISLYLLFQVTLANAGYDTIKLIDIAGNQMRLSQQIAKDYLYSGKNISKDKADKEMKRAMIEIVESHKILLKFIQDPEIQNLLSFVEMSTDDLKETASQPFSLDNAQLIIDLGESMLEGSEYVINSLKEKAKVNKSKIVELSSRQSMLSQRIAKYYIAYQSGIKDKNTVVQMQEAVEMFTITHDRLLKNKLNTAEINKKLNQIDRLWKIVYKFYLNIQKGGLPLIVFKTTNDITHKMGDITKLYVQFYR